MLQQNDVTDPQLNGRQQPFVAPIAAMADHPVAMSDNLGATNGGKDKCQAMAAGQQHGGV